MQPKQVQRSLGPRTLNPTPYINSQILGLHQAGTTTPTHFIYYHAGKQQRAVGVPQQAGLQLAMPQERGLWVMLGTSVQPLLLDTGVTMHHAGWSQGQQNKEL